MRSAQTLAEHSVEETMTVQDRVATRLVRWKLIRTKLFLEVLTFSGISYLKSKKLTWLHKGDDLDSALPERLRASKIINHKTAHIFFQVKGSRLILSIIIHHRHVPRAGSLWFTQTSKHTIWNEFWENPWPGVQCTCYANEVIWMELGTSSINPEKEAVKRGKD